MVIQPGLKVSSTEMPPTASSLVPAHKSWIDELPGTGRNSTTERDGLRCSLGSAAAVLRTGPRQSLRPHAASRREDPTGADTDRACRCSRATAPPRSNRDRGEALPARAADRFG